MALALATVMVGALSGAAVVWPSRDRLVRSRLRDRVIVTLKSGVAFSGVLVEADAKSFILRDAQALTPHDSPVPVDGELVVARPDVDYLQRP